MSKADILLPMPQCVDQLFSFLRLSHKFLYFPARVVACHVVLIEFNSSNVHFLLDLTYLCGKFMATSLLKAGIQAGYDGPAVRTIAWLGRFLAPLSNDPIEGPPSTHHRSQPTIATASPSSFRNLMSLGSCFQHSRNRQPAFAQHLCPDEAPLCWTKFALGIVARCSLKPVQAQVGGDVMGCGPWVGR